MGPYTEERTRAIGHRGDHWTRPRFRIVSSSSTKEDGMNEITISRGNIKLRCNSWSLPAGRTCKKGLECRKICYAKKAEWLYKAVLPSRNRNLKASKKITFVEEVTNILRNRKVQITRVHESGDFYSKEYLEKWYQIARNLPKMQFYAYTKRDDIVTPAMLEKRPKNFRIHWSLDGVREDTEDISKEANKWLKKGFDLVSVIRKTKTSCLNQVDKHVGCMTDCKICLRKRGTIDFKKH